ncbi:RcnB family protein [Sphingomonas sp. LT1P40]|uniref:RcnB family protein n=1 Tax=Alteristakelama amylovorans TaxID=3096166 RepID=UPI002FCC21D1
MKKFVLAAVAASMIASPVLMAAPAAAAPQRHQTVVKQKPNGKIVVKQKVNKQAAKRAQRVQYRTFQRGQRFDQRYARNYRQVDYRQYRGLRAPPRGYRYVQSGNDAVLVGITSGIIAAVFSGMIR